MIRSVQARIDGGLVGRLEDGTPYFAPLGQLLWDPEEDRVQCHLCGGWFLFLAAAITFAWVDAGSVSRGVPAARERADVLRADQRRAPGGRAAPDRRR